MIDLSGVSWSTALPAQTASLTANLVLVLLGDLCVVGGVSPFFVVVEWAWLKLTTPALGASSRGWLLWLL